MAAIGLMIEGQWGLTWGRWRKLIQAAEEMGYDCLFRSDHYTIGPPDSESLETFVSLTYAADHSSRIEFGPLVAPTTFRHPALTARMGAAIDDLSGGRFVLGLGVGWHEREHLQFGVPFYDKNTRFEMFEDALEITTKLLKSDAPVSYSGKHFSLDEAILLPRPQRPGGPRLLIGGNGIKRTLGLVARYADEWNGYLITPEDYRERNTRLNELLEEQGRSPSSVKRSFMTALYYGKDDAATREKIGPRNMAELPERIGGTTSEVIDQLGRFVDAGVERFMLQWRELEDYDGLERLAREVLPHFHTT